MNRRLPHTDTHDHAISKISCEGPCPVMRACGGCEWLNLPYRKQLTRKQHAMEELFGPLIAELDLDCSVEPVRGMGANAGDTGKIASPRGFRHKAASPFAPAGKNHIASGFFARGTHRIVGVPDCCVEAPGARAILNSVARAAEACHIPAYEEDQCRGLLRYAIVRMGYHTEEVMLTIITRERRMPHYRQFITALQNIDERITTVAQNINPKMTNAILGGESHILAGRARMRDRLLSCTFEISPTAFYQTNPEQTEVLYQLAIDGMDLKPGDVLLDAYCGSGTIGMCAAAEAKAAGVDITLLGIERNHFGVRDAVRNAEVNDLCDRSRFIEADATEYLQHAARRGEHVDVLALDPPRAGSTLAFIEAACAMAPRRIVYISCNPYTQERDLRLFAQGGYRMIRMTPVDMFPHTSHVETVAVLTR
ncbi:23S rRNA (uracil(1939)-C(5))-methyltransferase RlmD [Collinsella bouchesdurhonensis]|uniref:23S rRNA (uracil(1939)-C(5))-methyltransferase RlmD n=1 Tax=Collinsella bouchesdurhonensis TaxID=1907654 RepID=UPI003F9087EC